MKYNFNYSSSFSLPDVTKKLLIINGIVFLLQTLYPSIESLISLNYYMVVYKFRIWQIFTYMFAHGGLTHILFNMLMLFMFGRQLENDWGSKKFLKFYLVSGTGAGLFIFLIDFLSVSTGTYMPHTTIGASGAILGLLLAYGLRYPNHTVYVYFVIPVKIKYIVGLSVVMALWPLVFGSSGNISHAGHLGGMITAFIFIILNKKDYTFAPENNSIGLFLKKIKSLFKKKVPFEERRESSWSDYFQRNSMSSSKDDLDESRMSDAEIEQKIDDLLDIISARGLKGLSLEQQMFLDRVSKQFQHKFPH